MSVDDPHDPSREVGSISPTEDDFHFVVLRPMGWAVPRYVAAQETTRAELEGLWAELGIDGLKYRGLGRPSLRALAQDERHEVAGWGRKVNDRFGLLANYRDATIDDEEFEARLLLRDVCAEQESVLPGGSKSLTGVLGKIEEPEWEVVAVSRSEQVEPLTLGFDLGWAPYEADDPFYSVVSDCAILPLWHGPPDDVIQELRKRLAVLNQHQLFDSHSAASEFRAWYDDTEWGEEGDFEIWRVNAAPVVPPPEELDGARCLEWALVEGNEATGATRHFGSLTSWDRSEVTGTFARLAICAYDDESAYLFYCNDLWQVVNDTQHDSVEDAMAQAAFEYSEPVEWREA